jgi:hypothetical protein
MLELLGWLLSWSGVMTIIVVFYVVDDIFMLGLTEYVRSHWGRRSRVDLLQDEINRLRAEIKDIALRTGTVTAASPGSSNWYPKASTPEAGSWKPWKSKD